MTGSGLYRLATGAYFTAIRISSLFNAKAGLFVEGRKGLLTAITKKLESEQRPRIWMHCASLGEFEQGRPLLEAIRSEFPQYALVLTFFSPSGYEVRKDYGGADYIFYLPVDTPANAGEFIEAVQPSMCLFVKYELWYYYLAEIARRQLPAILVSAVFNERQGFFKWYGGLQRKMLNCFSRIFVQDNHSSELLQNLGVKEVTISGDTRFDRVIKASGAVSELPIAKEFCLGHSVIIAGSTWREDEQFLKEVLNALPEQWRMILVPHEVHEGHLINIEQLYPNEITRWSKWVTGNPKRVLLVDKIGLLLSLYAYGDVAWIGGGFGKDGVHNVLEAAVYGLPCYYGPVFHQFIEAQELVANGGALACNNAAVLVQQLNSAEGMKAMGDAARQYVAARGGATEKVMQYVRTQLGKSVT